VSRRVEPGDRIGRYVVEELLGEGGMGHVYRAYDATLRRRVALKLLRPNFLLPQDGESTPSVARILREARAAAALDHPNVVSIFDVGEQDGTPFIVMELVKGRPLRAFVGDAGIPVDERIRWMLDTARAMGAAHKAGLVHRDVKPENVLVREDGVVKVLDFGIARLDRPPSLRPPPGADAPPASTRSPSSGMRSAAAAAAATFEQSTLAGTPAYMAPEQIRRDHVDARADQFSWGVVTYELLTGRPPWTNAKGNVAQLISILEEPPPPLEAERLGIPAPWANAIVRALSKRPSDRYASMDDLLASVGMVPPPSTSGPFRTQPPDAPSAPAILATASAGSLSTAAERATSAVDARAARTRRARLLGGAAAAVVIAALGGAILARRDSGPSPPPDPSAAAAALQNVFDPHDPRRLTFEQGCEEFPSLTPDGRTVVFDSSIGEDVQIVAMDVTTGTQRRLTTDAGWHFAPTVSPDGASVAFVLQNGDDVATWIAPVDGSAPAHKLMAGRVRPEWTPDGRAIWAGATASPSRIDLATGQAQRTLEPPPGYFLLRARELRDGRVVGRLLERETKLGRGLVLYGAQDGPPQTLFADDTEDALAVAPDGRSILAPKLLSTGRVELWRMPLDGSPASIVPSNVVLPRKGMVVARDGSQVLWSTCATEQDIAALRSTGDRAPLEAVQLLPKTEWTDDQPAGVPGSPSRMVVVSDRAARRQLWVVDVAGKDKDAVRKLATGDREVSAPAVSPDGRWVAFTVPREGIHVVALEGSSEVRRLTRGLDDTGATFSHDGAFVYFATTSGTQRAVARVRFEGESAPEIVVEGADRPSASPVDDRLAFVAVAGEAGTPTILDRATKRSRPLSPELRPGSYGSVRFSPDGRRVALWVGLTQLLEIDAASGAVVRRFDSGDQITSVTYVGRDLVISRIGWRGDLWSARDPWGPMPGALDP
jgi:serine/threonine-protein kinase